MKEITKKDIAKYRKRAKRGIKLKNPLKAPVLIGRPIPELPKEPSGTSTIALIALVISIAALINSFVQ